uniref:Uncharacterized protein n=1 Tax=Timema bartmani TaxID=61472 RepID=A0A7R9EVS4_9NEOP|nr:unnamed protein product [Timema bartmani]
MQAVIVSSGGEETEQSTPNRGLKLDLPIISSLFYCESSALDHAATEVAFLGLLLVMIFNVQSNLKSILASSDKKMSMLITVGEPPPAWSRESGLFHPYETHGRAPPYQNPGSTLTFVEALER